MGFTLPDRTQSPAPPRPPWPVNPTEKERLFMLLFINLSSVINPLNPHDININIIPRTTIALTDKNFNNGETFVLGPHEQRTITVVAARSYSLYLWYKDALANPSEPDSVLDLTYQNVPVAVSWIEIKP
jgi:hypothetical protein